jgi:hypothetical protein
VAKSQVITDLIRALWRVNLMLELKRSLFDASMPNGYSQLVTNKNYLNQLLIIEENPRDAYNCIVSQVISHVYGTQKSPNIFFR